MHGFVAMLLALFAAMRIIATAFLGGVCLVQTRAALDGQLQLAAVLWCVAALGVLVLAMRGPRRGAGGGSGSRGAGTLGDTVAGVAPRLLAALLALAAFAAGVGWTAWRAELRLHDALASTLEGADVLVRGRVAELPEARADGWRFVFDVEPGQPGVPSRIQLAWYPARDAHAPLPAPVAGERWAFEVRLRRPHGHANPGGFDYEAWLLERGIRATGYVRGQVTLLDAQPAGFMQRVHRARGRVRDALHAALPHGDHTGLLVALAVGERSGITPEAWDIFRRTGVGHLVSISGLHVALVGLLCGGALGALWRRVPALALRWPVQKARAVAALVAAGGYALLAGLGIPVQRAWLMLFVAVLAVLGGRRLAPSRVLALALLVVLVVDPWAVLAAGFWLSFGAVAVILAALGGRLRAPRGWRAALRIQLAVSLALMPLLVAQFQSFPLVSPLANLVAVPLVSFVIAPLVLLAIAWPHALLLWPADAAAGWMMKALAWMAALPLAFREQAAPPGWLTGAALAAVALLLLPRATPGRMAAPLVLAGLLAWQPPRPAAGGFVAQVLDVGQGLAVHVQTQAHDLLFDTGPAYGRTSDAGERVVLPYLRAAGVRRLDRLLVSHADADHAGGVASVLAGTSVGAVLAGQGVVLARPGGSGAGPADARGGAGSAVCRAGQAWDWDGVRFEILNPSPGAALRSVAGTTAVRAHDNDASCVLRISAAGGSLLLTGDIGTRVEAALLAAHGASGLHAEVVVSAHHGSRSSSSAAFVDALLPEHVVHAAGHGNAFGHPHPEVWARWAEAGARNWRTDAQGAIRIVASAAAAEGVSVSAARERRQRYWHGR